MEQFSFLGNAEIEAIDGLYKQYQHDASSVNEQWQFFFKGFDLARQQFNEEPSALPPQVYDKEFAVLRLIEEYRRRGHLFTQTNPVRTRRQYLPKLDIELFGLSTDDLQKEFRAGNDIGIGTATLQKIIDHLKTTYCVSVGAEYMYIRIPERMQWLKERMESSKNITILNNEEKKQIYHWLKQASGFERFIHKKFVGQKRFSLEGTENIIPALHTLINYGSELGVEECLIGMAHRGRLTVLTNVLNKPAENIFKEFKGDQYEENIMLGDVKYHLGFDNVLALTNGKQMKIAMAPNPSHLETVAPIVQGVAQAQLINHYNGDENKVLPIAIHGDAAVATQGVVYEVLQMSELPGYKNGGTVHIVINNQIGFTTNYLEARSSTYCTDIAKVTLSPVFHVNGDDAEAVVHTVKVALEYRQKYHSDVFIDILSYRKYGHNEGDDPRFTQPKLYDIIAKHPNPRDIYAKKLIEEAVMTTEEVAKAEADFDQQLENSYENSLHIEKVVIKQFMGDEWKNFRYANHNDFDIPTHTAVDKETLLTIANKITELPSNLNFFNKIHKLMEDRRKMITENRLDWAMGELLAYGSLLNENAPVRLSGQDSVRGTFSHRHAGLVTEDTDQKYFPLQHLSDTQAQFTALNSPLSEYGVLGFEYGYALSCPKGLTIWEAQFGDFHNVAQVIIDQYITSAEEKWGLMNGLTIFLPHSFEGQGPEHSSGRPERFLALCANRNIQVANCTTPANMFHILRRQVKREFKKPLIIFTPKSLLRHPRCVSTLEDLSEGTFQEVIDDVNVDIQEVRRLVFCTGKIYYDLLERKDKLNARDVALVRIEQLYPFPDKQVKAILKKYNKAVAVLWVQEEPLNMGAWPFIRNRIPCECVIPVGRMESASPAVGLHELHMLEQEEIISKVFRHCDCERKNVYCGLQCVEGKSQIEIEKELDYLFDCSKVGNRIKK